MNTSMPFSVHDNVDHPGSACTRLPKKPTSSWPTPTATCTAFRLRGCASSPSTAVGPPGYGPLPVHQCHPRRGTHQGLQRRQNARDFTYIDDIIEGVMRVMARIPQPDPAWDSAKPNPSTSTAPWRIYNIGNNNTVELGTFISTLEDALGKKAIRNLMPMQPGDVEATWGRRVRPYRGHRLPPADFRRIRRRAVREVV